MNSAIAKQLIELNRKFYDDFGNSFSATRRRLQSGVMKIVETIHAEESVLDLGCGNGNFLQVLKERGHIAPLLGVDFSPPLLRDAESTPGIGFYQADLNEIADHEEKFAIHGGWNVIAMFAALHHIPSKVIRLDVLKSVRGMIHPSGRFILSNWQFLNSEKLKARIQPWARIGVSESDVDEDDYLLDWRSGGNGLRYAHHFSAAELLGLAEQARFKVEAQFLSDGENGKLGLYQVWRPL